MTGLNGFDQFWLSFFSGLPAAWTPLFHLVTYLGDSPVILAPSIVAFALGKRDMRALAAVLIIGLLVGNLVMGDLKDLIKRPRPDMPRIQDYMAQMSYAFPSGHAMTAFIAASIIGGYFGGKIRAASYVVAGLVAVSRVYLGLHYATDVIAGAMIGMLIGETVILLAYRLNICRNTGILGRFHVLSIRKRKVAPENTAVLAGFSGPAWHYIIIAILLVLIMAAYFTGYSLIAIALSLVIPVLIIISNDNKILTEKAELVIALFAILIGIIAAFLLYIFTAYLFSLGFIIITAIALIWLTHPQNSMPCSSD